MKITIKFFDDESNYKASRTFLVKGLTMNKVEAIAPTTNTTLKPDVAKALLQLLSKSAGANLVEYAPAKKWLVFTKENEQIPLVYETKEDAINYIQSNFIPTDWDNVSLVGVSESLRPSITFK
jgi:hypothetical protein